MASNSAMRKAVPVPEELASVLKSGWELLKTPKMVDGVAGGTGEEEQRLRRQFRFSNFSAAWGFMNRVALVAEKLNVSYVTF